MFMYQELISISNRLEGAQKFMFIFWGICVCLFLLSFINLVIHGVKLKISKIK
jgi:hypothetical protein